MKFLDLFAGVGGFRLAFEMAGHECDGYVEWDKFARKSYEAIHDTKGEWTAHDITAVTDVEWQQFNGTVDIICGGFPCQAFSIAGHRRGFEDTRGTMFFEIARAAKQIKPRYLVLENVKGLLSHDKGETFATILTTLDELGYDAEWQVLNTAHFSTKEWPTPQNRERVFIIGHLRGTSTREVLPIRPCCEKVNDSYITTGTLTARYPASQREGTYIEEVRERGGEIKLAGMLDIKGQDCIRRVYDTGGISPSLTTMQGGGQEPKIVQPVLTPDRLNKRQNGRRFKEDGEPMFTITAQDKHGVAIQEPFNTTANGDTFAITTRTHACYGEDAVRKNRATLIKQTEPKLKIRKLTPRECWRLQGFPDWAFDKAQEVNSDSQLYKQAGNSVSVNVAYEIAKRLI